VACGQASRPPVTQPHQQETPSTGGPGEPMVAAGHDMDAPGTSAVRDEGFLGGPGKRQRTSGDTPVGRQVKRPKQTGQPSYARVAREGIRVAIVCEGYPGNQVFKDNFVAIKAVDRLVNELSEEGFTPVLAESYWTKGAAIMVCQDEGTCDWLTGSVPNMTAWEGSKLKVMGLEVLPTFKRDAVFNPGPRGRHGYVSSVSPQTEPGSGDRTLEGLRAQGLIQWSPNCAQY
jgi:hypothetical protein